MKKYTYLVHYRFQTKISGGVCSEFITVDNPIINDDQLSNVNNYLTGIPQDKTWLTFELKNISLMDITTE